MKYMGYTIAVQAAATGDSFTASVEHANALGQVEQVTVSGASETAAVDAAKRLVRMSVNNKLPLGLAARVSGT